MDIDELIKAIESAFDGVARPETSLRQFLLTDKYGMSREITDKEWTHAGKTRVDNNWTDIPDSEIEECDCLLAHMQAEEFRYYLPAYMRYSVKNYQKPIWENDVLGMCVSSLYPSPTNNSLYAYKISQFALINNAQKQVVVQFLKFIANVADYVQRPDATKALEQYWSRNVGT
jgi:hypothetical protein